ncbi:MAG: response regulator [Deltaproteobacteria bacterium]|nr:response regulator [Deltaproteobacteria bacterium]
MAYTSEKRILVVDDEPDVRNFLAACIEDAGFQVETAVDGTDAYEKIGKNKPDLMTLDMVMPRTSGIQLIRKLRKEEKYADLPVIVITAHAHDEFGSEDLKGFNAFTSGLKPRYMLEKPITPKKLVDAIGTILDVPIEEESIKPTIEQQKIIDLISKSDEETLRQIGTILNKEPK